MGDHGGNTAVLLHSDAQDEGRAGAEQLHKKVRERVKSEEQAAVNEIDGSMSELVTLLSDRLVGSGAEDNKALIDECVGKSKE